MDSARSCGWRSTPKSAWFRTDRLRIADSLRRGTVDPLGGRKVHKSVKFCIMAGTAMPRSHRGMGVSPVNGPFGVQALACPAQCSLKAELRTCAHRILFLRMLLFGDSTKFLVFLDRLDFALLSTASKIVRGRSSDLTVHY